MKTFLVCATAACLLTACDKPKPTEPAPARPVAPPPRVAPSTPASTLPTPDGTSTTASSEEPSLSELNRAVSAYTMGMLKEPASLDELVKAGFIKRVPAPPPGKKFVLNAKKSAVLAVDK